MNESFADMLAVGGKTNSLGRAGEVLRIVLGDESRLGELYRCIFDPDAWVRMRAIDTFEKVCRVHPEQIEPYIDRFPEELATSTQPSILWHLAELYGELELNEKQKDFAIKWLKRLLSTKDVDWIVAANAMNTLAQFVREGTIPPDEMVPLLRVQQGHKSKAVVKRAVKLHDEITTKY
jgi:hypothetical protein